MNDQTNYTPPTDDNRAGITSRELLNLYEAAGVARAELVLQQLEEDAILDITFLLQLHRTAFGELYEWAGKWRTLEVQVGNHVPPGPARIPNLMYQFSEELDFRLKSAKNRAELEDTLAWLHHRFVWIHPFNNGNGRTARLLLNAAALLNGYRPLQLYHREGESRKIYIEAIRQADTGDLSALRSLISKELTAL